MIPLPKVANSGHDPCYYCNMRSLSVVVPAYNEEANVATCIRDVAAILKKTDWDWEILIVNDGSKDKTAEVAEATIRNLKLKNAKVLTNLPNRGYGGALKRGFSEATKDFIAFVPADNQFDFSEIHRLVAVQEKSDADIVTGIRPGGGKDPVHRLIIRWAANSLVRAVFGYLATDVDCGFKLFKRSVLSRVSIPSDGALIDTELFAGARARGMKIEELPVKHLPRTAGSSTGGNPKVLFKALRELAGFWWNLKSDIRVERGKAVFRWEALAMAIIILVAGYVRLYKISQYMTFLGDEGRDVSIVRQIVTGEKFTLIGPGTSIGNMYLGPLYYYLMTVPLAIWQLSPVGPAVMVAGFGLATVALLWWVARQWVDRVSALAVALLYALSPTVIIYSRSSWNPNIMPFFALLGMYAVWKVWRFGYWRWLVIAAVCLAFILNSHYLGLLLAPVMGIFWLKSRKNLSAWRYTFIALVAFVLLMSPLVLFDMRHGWTNAAALHKFFAERQTTVNIKVYKAIPNLWPLWVQIVHSLVAAHNTVAASISAVVIIAGLIWGLWVKNIRRDVVFIVVWLGVALVGLGLYKQHIYDHYFGFIFPAVFLALGFVFHLLSRNRIGQGVALASCLGLLMVNIADNPLRYGPNNQLTHTRVIADFINRESGNRDFNLALLSSHNYDMSYRYFLTLDQAKYKTIHEKQTDQLFVICEEAKCEPINNPMWEVAAFGWAKTDGHWEFPWGAQVYRLVHNPTGAP